MKRRIEIKFESGHYGTGERGSLINLLIMISHDTNCSYDAGDWTRPFAFMPDTDEHEKTVRELLTEFSINTLEN